MTPFRAMRRGYESRMDPVERAVLARVARDVATMVRDETGLPASAPEPDPNDVPTPHTGSTTRVWNKGLLAPDEITDGDLAKLTGISSVGPKPSDPAVRRLLPDASRSDDAVAAEFRRLTQNDLAREKAERLEAFADLLEPPVSEEDPEPEKAPWQTLGRHGAPPPVRVSRESAEAVAGALTDMRLVIAQRLGLESDDDVNALTDQVMWDQQMGREIPVAADGRAARRFWSGVFVAAGFALETLMEVMIADLRGRPRPPETGADED